MSVKHEQDLNMLNFQLNLSSVITRLGTRNSTQRQVHFGTRVTARLKRGVLHMSAFVLALYVKQWNGIVVAYDKRTFHNAWRIIGPS